MREKKKLMMMQIFLQPYLSSFSSSACNPARNRCCTAHERCCVTTEHPFKKTPYINVVTADVFVVNMCSILMGVNRCVLQGLFTHTYQHVIFGVCVMKMHRFVCVCASFLK